MVIVDTDVLINYLRNKPRAVAEFAQIGFAEITITSVTAMELFQGVRDRHELVEVKRFLRSFELVYPSTKANQLATRWAAEFCLSHSPIDIADLLIAAVAVLNGYELHTDNKKHFRHLPGLRIWQAPSTD